MAYYQTFAYLFYDYFLSFAFSGQFTAEPASSLGFWEVVV